MQLECVRMHGLEPAGQQGHPCSSTCCNDSPQQHQLAQESISSKNLPSLHSNTPLCQSPLKKVNPPGPLSCQPAASVPAGMAACACGPGKQCSSTPSCTSAQGFMQITCCCRRAFHTTCPCTSGCRPPPPPARLAKITVE